jgi:hypothetical protein
MNHGDKLILLEDHFWEKGTVVEAQYNTTNYDDKIKGIYCVHKIGNGYSAGYVPKNKLLKLKD